MIHSMDSTLTNDDYTRMLYQGPKNVKQAKMVSNIRLKYPKRVIFFMSDIIEAIWMQYNSAIFNFAIAPTSVICLKIDLHLNYYNNI